MHEQRLAELQRRAGDALVAADYRTLREASREILALGESTGDERATAWGDYFTGIVLIYNNEGGPATRALRRALRYFRDNGERVVAARTMINLAMVEIDINLNASEARRLYEEAAPAIREEGDTLRLAILYGNLAEVCRLEGDYDASVRHGRESIALFREIGDRGHLVWQLVTLAHIQALRRDYAAAVATLRDADAALGADLSAHWIAMYFDMWVIVSAKLERWDDTARLLGYVDRMRSEENAPRLQGMLPWLSSPMERLAAMTSQARVRELFLEGEALTFDGARALANGIGATGSTP